MMAVINSSTLLSITARISKYEEVDSGRVIV